MFRKHKFLLVLGKVQEVEDMVEWWRIVVAVVCLCLSGLFSGLTLGLFALDLTDLDILLDSGTEKEKTYAKKIYPLRKRGNYLLCTLLIGNTAVNSALAIVTAELFGGKHLLEVCSILHWNLEFSSWIV